MEKVRLRVKDVLSIMDGEGTSLVILVDEEAKRQVSVIVDQTTVERIEYRRTKPKTNEKLLPEALCSIIEGMGGSMEIIIFNVIGGEYKAMLNCEQMPYPIRLFISDAVILSIVADIPIFIESALMKRQSVPYQKGEMGIALPVNTLSLDMLRRALNQAVADENYELASHLRDEMNRRDDQNTEQY